MPTHLATSPSWPGLGMTHDRIQCVVLVLPDVFLLVTTTISTLKLTEQFFPKYLINTSPESRQQCHLPHFSHKDRDDQRGSETQPMSPGIKSTPAPESFRLEALALVPPLTPRSLVRAAPAAGYPPPLPRQSALQLLPHSLQLPAALVCCCLCICFAGQDGFT